MVLNSNKEESYETGIFSANNSIIYYKQPSLSGYTFKYEDHNINDRQQYPNKVFIKASWPHNYKSPTRIASSWSFVLKVNTRFEKNMYQALLAAKANNREVNLTGNQTCKIHKDVEGFSTYPTVQFLPSDFA